MRRLLISLAALLPLAGVAAVQAYGFGGGSEGSTQTNQVMVVGTIVSVDATNGKFVANAFVVPQYDHGFGFGHPGGPGSGYGGFGGFGGFGFPGFGSGGFGFGGGTGATGATGVTGGHWGPGGFPTWGPTGGTGVTGYPGGFGGFGPGGFGGFSADYRAHDGVTGGTGATGTYGGPTMPTPTQVTITIGTSTKLKIAGNSSPTVAGLAAGDRFRAVFTGSPTDPITSLVSSAPLEVDAAPAPKKHQLYAFAGTVTGTSSNSVTVTLFGAVPSTLGAAGSSATFTVGSSTLVLGGSSGFGFSMGGVGNIAKGDIVAGGLIGTAGQTAAQVSADPLMLLLDIPAGTITGATGATGVTGTSGVASAALKREKAAELKRAEALLGYSAKPAKKSHKSHKSHTAHK